MATLIRSVTEESSSAAMDTAMTMDEQVALATRIEARMLRKEGAFYVQGRYFADAFTAERVRKLRARERAWLIAQRSTTGARGRVGRVRTDRGTPVTIVATSHDALLVKVRLPDGGELVCPTSAMRLDGGTPALAAALAEVPAMSRLELMLGRPERERRASGYNVFSGSVT